MSVTIRQTSRNAFAAAVPVLTPLYNAGCNSWPIVSEGEFQCGNSDHCHFPLRIDGIDEQHCSFLFQSGRLKVRSDRGRVWVNDLPVSRETDLSPGDILNIGPMSFEVGQTILQDEQKPTPPVTEKPSPTIGDVSSASHQLLSGSLRSNESIESASLLARESVGVAEALLTQIEGQMHALHLREERCREYDQASAAREAAIRDTERKLEERSEELTRLQHEMEVQQAELSRHAHALKAQSLLLSQRSEELDALAAELAQQKLDMDSADAANRREANQLESPDTEHVSAIACERESLLKTRDEAIQSLAKIEEQNAALSVQESRLQAWQAELESRYAELARQTAVVQTREEELSSREARVLETLAADTTERIQLSDSLNKSEHRCRELAQERETLLTAVCELKEALENARSDVEQANRIHAESKAHEKTLSQLYQRIEDCSAQLDLKDSLLNQANDTLNAVNAIVAQLTEERDELRRLIATVSVPGEAASGNETESQLLHEIEALRDEVNQRASSAQARQSETESQFRDMLAKRDEQTRELQAEIATLGEQLRNRDDVIRELSARLMQSSLSTPASAYDEERILNESRELDRRAALLDQRDEELRERSRRIDQSEEDIEIQRRQLLEARQQLEQARAEIQVAISQHAASASDQAAAETCENSAGFGDHTQIIGGTRQSGESVIAAAEEIRTTSDPSAANDLRFELAALFGVHKSREESEAAPVLPTQEFIDLSEPAGESRAVAFRFGEDASSFIQSLSADSTPAAAADTPREENSDDFVRDYMEQLLSRSRKSAGNALPEELKPSESSGKNSGVSTDIGRTRTSTEASLQKSPAKVRSFIDQYMSGDFGDLTGDGSISVAPVVVPEEAPAIVKSQVDEPLVPRAKIDLRKMRENMDSFRTLSTQSVEHALVNHALRKERHNINGRIMLVLALMGMCLFLAVANIWGIINHPSLTWVALVAAIGAAVELGQKLYGFKSRCQGVLAVSEISGPPDENAVSEANASVSRNAFTSTVECSETPDASIEAPDLPPHPDLPDRPRTTISNEAERSSRYFEL